MRLTLATHVQNPAARKFRRTKHLVAGVVLTLGVSVAGLASAHAAPAADPSSSSDAKKAWEDSTHQAEVVAEQVNGATQAQRKAEKAARQAAADLSAAKGRATASEKAANAASASVATYQFKLDAFASASYRGARLSQLSVMLTAKSADDFLDESTVINRVAQDTQKTLAKAIAAKDSAAKAELEADAAAASSVTAKTDADAAAVTAVAATAAAKNKKTQLDEAVTKYKTLYSKLSAQEKAAAAAAAEKARQESLAAAAAAAAQAQADAVAAAKAADDSASSSSASSSSASASSRSANSSSANSAATSRTESATTTPANDVSTTPANDASTAPATDASTTSSVEAPASSSESASESTTASESTKTEAVKKAPTSSEGGDSAGSIAAEAAKTKIGGGYAYAADGPDVFDCSGLTTWAWAQAGVSIPRVSFEQANFPEVPLDQLQPGDLVTYYSPVSHVSIYVGNGMVVSAADESLGIIFVPVERGGPNPTGHRVPRG